MHVLTVFVLEENVAQCVAFCFTLSSTTCPFKLPSVLLSVLNLRSQSLKCCCLVRPQGVSPLPPPRADFSLTLLWDAWPERREGCTGRLPVRRCYRCAHSVTVQTQVLSVCSGGGNAVGVTSLPPADKRAAQKPPAALRSGEQLRRCPLVGAHTLLNGLYRSLLAAACS